MPKRRTHELNPKQKRAINALLETPTITAAAKQAGVSRRGLHRYLNNPLFKSELRRKQGEILAGTTAVLVAGTEHALRALIMVLTDRDASHTERTAAARAWRDWAQGALDQDMILRRIEDMERKLDERDR